MPIAGFRRFRKVQVGITSSISSNVAATRQLSYRGPLVYEPNRTQPDVDTGSLDPMLASFFGAVDVTSPWTGNQSFDELPYIYALGIKGGVTPTGSATGRIWTYQAASLTADPFDYATQQWGDDVTYDIITGGAGVINDLSLSFGEDLSAFATTANLFFARAAFGSNSGFTGGLILDASPEWLYGAHTVIYMDVNAAAIGTTPILDAVHAASFSVNNNLDKKRFANGSNSGFNLAGFGRGPREIEFKITLAKTVQTVTEAQTLDDVPVPTRYFDIKTTSTEIIPGGTTPFSNSIRFPAELIARDDGELENNTTIELTYRGKYDATFGVCPEVRRDEHALGPLAHTGGSHAGTGPGPGARLRVPGHSPCRRWGHRLPAADAVARRRHPGNAGLPGGALAPDLARPRWRPSSRGVG